jgi:pimeloyl-ACP methyl ester carboxylesterase
MQVTLPIRLIPSLVSLLLAAGLLAGCVSLRLGGSEAGLVIEDLMVGVGGSRLKSRTESPTRTSIRFGGAEDTYRGDVYTPTGPIRAAIVLVPGLAPAGKDDSRLVNLARTLARVDFMVLVPDVPGFRSYRMRADDVEVLVDALLRLPTLPRMRTDTPNGIGGFSYAVGPAVIAALDPRVRERVDFVVGVGGYYDLHILIAYYTTGAQRRDGDALTYYDKGKWIFAMGIANQLPSSSDALAIESMARSRVFGYDDPGDVIIPADLSPGGAALLELLTNTTPERVTELLARLPESLKQEITALNPAEQNLPEIHARLILLHGRGDPIIPHTESVAMAEAAPDGRAQLFLIDGLAHVDLAPKWGDVEILLEMVNAVLDQRAPRT